MGVIDRQLDARALNWTEGVPFTLLLRQSMLEFYLGADGVLLHAMGSTAIHDFGCCSGQLVLPRWVGLGTAGDTFAPTAGNANGEDRRQGSAMGYGAVDHDGEQTHVLASLSHLEAFEMALPEVLPPPSQTRSARVPDQAN